MGMTAGDIMERHINSVSESAPLIDVHRLFVEEEIHGAPVISDDGRVLGVISSADLLRAVFETHESGGESANYLRDAMEYSGPDWSRSLPQDFQDRLSSLLASDFMTESLVSVAPSASIAEVAQQMRENRVHRVLVIEDDALRGIVSTFDLVRVLEKEGPGAG
ncbi:MAG: CBS domain-containing protein [Myxococcota bacterium]